MKIKAVTLRILNQLRRDKRTMALILFAPLIVLTLVYFILGDTDSTYKIIASAPAEAVEQLQNNQQLSLKIIDENGKDWSNKEITADPERLREAVKEQEAAAAVYVSADLKTMALYLDGTNSATAAKVAAVIKSSCNGLQLQNDLSAEGIPTAPTMTVNYVYGSAEATFFDNYGVPLIGIIVFFFVFLIAGINFLGERKSGTLEKMLSTPIKRRDIVLGYVLGYSILALLQTVLVTVFVVYVLGLNAEGSIWFVLFINLLTAVTALSLGILLSTTANSEFQMMQFIPLVIIPQIFLCGLFPLSPGWQLLSHLLPLTYTTDALTEVMIRGNGFAAVYGDMLVLLGFSAVFITGNILLLKKQRSI